jgi:ATP-binding cassette subfamily B protein
MSSVKAAVPVPRVLAFLFHHWGRQPVTAAFTASMIAAATLADIATPIFAGRLVDAVGTNGATAHREAVAAVLWLVGLGVFMVVVRQLGLLGIVRFSLRMMTEIKSEAFARVQNFSASWHADSFAGAVVRQVLRGAGAVDMLNDVFVFGLLPTAVVLLGATAVLGARWPAMGAAVGVGSIIYVALTTLLSLNYVAPAAELSNAWDTRLSGALADAITSNAAVRAFGAEQREEQRLGRVLGKWRRRTRRTWMRGVGSYSIQSTALVVLQGLITGTITWLWWQGRAGAGDVAVVLTTYFVLHGYLRNMSQNVRELQRGLADMQELVGLWSQPLTVMDLPGAPPLRVTAGQIEVRDITFRYSATQPPLFDGLSLAIEAGERVGLVGPSGSGKSTFVRLIQRLHDLDGGHILIDGQDIAAVAQNSLRSQIAIVPQEPSLFHRSLAENIAYGRPGASQADIEAAAKLARAHEFIIRQPKGYGTLVGERGVKLSGGERQRVAIARAFLADRPILVLDEATSSLDSESEGAIADAADRLMAGRTCIVIAHRLSTVRAMDRILVFRNGEVVEQGSHAALVAKPGGLYRDLFERQVLGLAEVG